MIRRIRVGNAMLCLLSYTLKVVGRLDLNQRDACSQSRWGTGLPNIPRLVPRVGIEPTVRPAQGFYRPRRPLGCSSAWCVVRTPGFEPG